MHKEHLYKAGSELNGPGNADKIEELNRSDICARSPVSTNRPPLATCLIVSRSNHVPARTIAG